MKSRFILLFTYTSRYRKLAIDGNFTIIYYTDLGCRGCRVPDARDGDCDFSRNVSEAERRNSLCECIGKVKGRWKEGCEGVESRSRKRKRKKKKSEERKEKKGGRGGGRLATEAHQ